MTANSAASISSCGFTASRIRRSTTSRSLSAAPIRRVPSWRRKRRACSRYRSGCRPISRMTTRCSSRGSSCTTRSTPGAAAVRTKSTIGRPRQPEKRKTIVTELAANDAGRTIPAHGIPLGEATRVWLRVAALSFGGPAGQIAVMHRIVVDEKKWISESRFLYLLSYCMLLPGPEAHQLKIYMGWLMHRWPGAIIAGGLFVLPGVVSIMALSWIYALYGQVPIVAALFFGLKAAVLAIVLYAVYRVGSRALKSGAMLALWLRPVIAILATLGLGHTFSEIGLLFSKMAVVTFGGAYAVLAYMAQQAVETYGWLRPGEMLDGLGMAETTPGPLIMVVQFVGFMAAYRDPGALPPLLAGTLGGLLATWTTFVPCFLWIGLGAPFIERLRNHKPLSGALAGITAAVVGVILNLAIWFALHSWFRDTLPVGGYCIGFDMPVLASLNPWALILSLAAMVAIFRFKAGTIQTLPACSAAGILLYLAGLATP